MTGTSLSIHLVVVEEHEAENSAGIYVVGRIGQICCGVSEHSAPEMLDL